jgi:hypothetical protein
MLDPGMEDKLESSVIRSLILNSRFANSPNFKFDDITEQVISSALNKKLIARRPQLNTFDRLHAKICDCVWALIVEGVFAPGHQHPFLRVTEYGEKCFETGELLPHDPDGYLAKLRSQCPSIDDVILMYLREALGTFRTDNHLATAVMVGVASEQVLNLLSDAVCNALSTPEKQEKFRRDIARSKAKQKYDVIMARLSSPVTPLPSDLNEDLELHLRAAYNTIIRPTRNDAGHPTGRRLDRADANALLMLFPKYCKTSYDLIRWLSENKI